MSAWTEVVLRLLALLVLVLASIGMWGVDIEPLGVFIALQVGAAAWVAVVLVAASPGMCVECDAAAILDVVEDA